MVWFLIEGGVCERDERTWIWKKQRTDVEKWIQERIKLYKSKSRRDQKIKKNHKCKTLLYKKGRTFGPINHDS